MASVESMLELHACVMSNTEKCMCVCWLTVSISLSLAFSLTAITFSTPSATVRNRWLLAHNASLPYMGERGGNLLLSALSMTGSLLWGERGEGIFCSQPSVWQAVYCGVREGRNLFPSALSMTGSLLWGERGEGIFCSQPSVWQAVYCGVREGRNFLLSALSNTDLLKHGLPHFPWSNGLRSPNQFPTGVHTHVATIGWLEGNLCLWASYHSEDLSRLRRVIWVCVCVCRD